jgi:hypothetical protein
MTRPTDEFIRRFLIHVLPMGFHRIRHYGLVAQPGCDCAQELAAAIERQGRSGALQQQELRLGEGERTRDYAASISRCRH